MLEMADILSSILRCGCVYRFIELRLIWTIEEYTNIIVETIKTDKIYLA